MITIVWFCHLTTGLEIRSSHQKRRVDNTISLTPVRTETVGSELTCVKECMEYDGCTSVSYQVTSGLCKMYTAGTAEVGLGTVLDEAGWTYIGGIQRINAITQMKGMSTPDW